MRLPFFGQKKAEPQTPSVLHIDDSKWVRLPVAIILQRHFGVKVMEANSGPEGLELAVSRSPTLILLDVIMPQMDGFDTLIKLKENPKTKDIPVIMVTARDIQREVAMAKKLGAADYLTKPIEENALIDKVSPYFKK